MKTALAWGITFTAMSLGVVARAEPPSSEQPQAPAPAPETKGPANDAKASATDTKAPANDAKAPASDAKAPADDAKPPETPAPAPAAAPAPAPAPAPKKSVSKTKIAGYVVEMAGLAGILTGAVALQLSAAKHGVIDEHCTASRVCDQTGMDAVSSASKLQTIGFASLVGGLAAIGIGVVLVVSGPADGANATVSPAVLSGGAALSVGGRF